MKRLLTTNFLSIALLLAAGCGTESNPSEQESPLNASEIRVQMNDVSVLYPLAETAAAAEGYLASWSDGRGGKLFPEAPYMVGTGAAASTLTGKPIGEQPPGPPDQAPGPAIDYGALRAVAFRVDPCFGVVGPIAEPNKCENQLRIVFQSLFVATIDGHTVLNATDDAVHAFYSITRPELVALLADLTKLREAQGRTDDLGPLAVHPLLVEHGLNGAYAAGLKAILAKYAGQDNLTRFTVMTSDSFGTRWLFKGFDVANGIPTPMTIATSPNSATLATFGGFVGGTFGGSLPATTSSDNLGLLLNFYDGQRATPADRQRAFDAALRIENPGFHSPNTIDCVSCHTAGPAKTVNGIHRFGLSANGNPNAFSADPTFVPAANMTATTTPEDMGRNIHAFSYMFRQPMIAARVINETASVVTYLNGTVLAK